MSSRALVRPLMTNTSGTMTRMKRIISQVNCSTPRSKLVCSLLADDGASHAAEIRFGPVATMTAVAVPLSTLVPRKQTFVHSSGERPAASSRAIEFLDGERLARQAGLGEKQVFAGDQPHVGGDHVARGRVRSGPRGPGFRSVFPGLGRRGRRSHER